MVTMKSLRAFSHDCLTWALQQDNPVHKQSIIAAALSRKATADAIDRRVREGHADVQGDLKSKLN